MICEHIFYITFVNESELFFQLNGFRYCNITLTL